MTTAAEQKTSVQVRITVDVPVEHAFQVFTQHFDQIKPREHNMLEVPIERTVLEPHVGGTIHDIGTDGSVCTWARILAFDPPNRLVFSWDITPQWEVEPDHSRSSEVELTFTAETPQRTRVTLIHRHLDRHGQGWQGFLRLDGGNGWPLYLERFRQVVHASNGR